MSTPHHVRPDHHELPRGTRLDGAGHDGTSLNRLPRKSTAPAGLWAPAPAEPPKPRAETTAPRRRSSVSTDAKCGTTGGYHRHLRVTKTTPCTACKAAHNDYQRGRYTPKRDAPPPCGTTQAYRRHLRAGEPTCEPCRTANAISQRAKKAERAAKTERRERPQYVREGCGTVAGYLEHKARKERRCPACTDAMNKERAA